MFHFHLFHLLFSPFHGILALAVTIFWIVMIVDVLRRQFSEPIVKVGWLLAVIFFHGLGALLYFFLGRPMGRCRV